MDYEAINYEVENNILVITLNRPEKLNALNGKMSSEILDALDRADSDDNVKSIIFTGKGRAFCAGADLKSPPGQLSEGSDRAVPFGDVMTAMMESPKPVITAVNGAAFAGGLGLVGASDIVITREDAQFSFSEVRIGVIPALISVVCLPKLGTHNGMKLFLTGERFDGHQAVTLGMAHRAVPAEALHAAVLEEVAMIKLGGPIAVQECKKLVRRVPQLSTADGFKETAAWSARMFKSDEGMEGMASFREKRKPSWLTNKEN